MNLIACAFKIFASAQDPAGISILHYRLILELRQLVSMIIHDFQRLFHMQLAAVTVTVGTVIVVQTIGTVGTLLNFADDNALSDGMHRTWLSRPRPESSLAATESSRP